MCIPDEQVSKGRVKRQRRHFPPVWSDPTRSVQGAQHDEGVEGLEQRGTAGGGDVVERGRVLYPHHLELQNHLVCDT